MNITVHYFAILRDRTRVDSETVATESVDPLGLWHELERKHGFGLDPLHFSVAVNDEFSEWNHALADGDTVVFLPPVSGG
jgi:molybdopterin synthase sulfur carrier subunit